MMALDYVSPPFGKAVVERGLRVVCQIKEKLNAAAASAKDISVAGSGPNLKRWEYEIRAYTGATNDTFVIRKTLAKSATDSATGWLDDYVPMGATAAADLTWELVEIDYNGADSTPTITTKREVILLTWQQSIEDAP